MPTKACLTCGEQIQNVASRCPHCHQVQSRVYQFFNTGWGVTLILGAATIGVVYFATREPVSWKDHAVSIKASEVTVKSTNRGTDTDMAYIALLKNEGTKSWREPVVEANFFGADGQLIDTATQRLTSVVLRAGSEARVRVLEQAAWQASEYAKCTVSVRHATLD